ncbi:unnamed protein product [Phaedon cochleariae]|uniref:Zinc finger protein n=1 Tax=Phaedon cochleariae TaxID=80249 RepID=A0A9N9SGD1_PHACE|nr:unnamed protein product [Phaedon cochleariae]
MTNICRLCLRSGDKCENIENLLRDLLDALLLKLDFERSKNPVICKDCLNRIHKLFDFKTLCLYTEDVLHPFINKQDGQVKQVNLLSVLSETKHLNSENVQICRLCLEVIKDSDNVKNEVLQNEFEDVFKNHLPEVSLHATNAPLICNNCRKHLLEFDEFVSVCTNTEERIKNISKEEVGPAQLVDLSELYSILPIPTKEEVYLKRESPIDYSDMTAAIQSLLDSCQYSQDTKLFKCCSCAFETAVKKRIKSHLLTHLDQSLLPIYKCEWENCTWTGRHPHSIKKHFKAHSKEIVCSVCDLKCYGDFEYRRHFNSTHKEGEFWRCNKCDYVSDSRMGLFRHVRVHREDFLECIKCTFKSKYRASMVEHNRVVHEKGLKRHKPRKEGADAYYCHDCSFITKVKASIRNHVLTHKSKSEMPLLECDECDYTSKSKIFLKKHKKTHLNIMYTCAVCDASFSSESGLEKHRRLHFKKKLKCPECDYENLDLYRLKVHMEKHQKVTAGTVHKCKSCSFQSAWKSCVSKHVRTVHKQKLTKENDGKS